MNTGLIPLPPVEALLFRLEPVPGWSETPYPPFRHLDGTLVVDQRGKDFKDYAFLPRHIPTKSPSHLLELWLGKSDSRIQTRDLFIRMNPVPSTPKLLANAINMQRVRFRTQYNIPCWTKRPAVPSQVECLVYEQLTWDSVIHNTILPVLTGVGLVMPALPDSLTATQPLVLPLTTYTGGRRPHAPSGRVKHIFDILAILQDTAFECGYPHWIFLENKYKPEAWSHKADCQQHPWSGPNDVAVPSLHDLPETARLWIEEGVKEAARKRSFMPPLSKLPDISRRQIHGLIAKVAVETNQPVASLLMEDSGTIMNFRPLPRILAPRGRAQPSVVQPAPSSQPMPRFRNIRPQPRASSTQGLQSLHPAQSIHSTQSSDSTLPLRPVESTVAMPKNLSSQGSQPMKGIQNTQNDAEDEWTDTSASDTEMEGTDVNNDHTTLATSDSQQLDGEDEWIDISSSDTEMEEVVAKNDHAALGTSEVEQGQIGVTTGIVAVNEIHDQRVQQLSASDGQHGQIGMVGERVARAKSVAVNENNKLGAQKAVSSDGQTGVMSNPIPVATNGNQLVGSTIATGHTAATTYTSPYPSDSANGGINYGATGSYLDQFNRVKAQFTHDLSMSAAQNNQGFQGNTVAPRPVTSFLRHTASLVATTPNGQEVQGVANTLQLAPIIHRHPATPVAATQTDQGAQGNVQPHNVTGFIRRRAAPSAAAQRAREAQAATQAAAEPFDPSSFIRRRVATESAIQGQQQVQGNGAVVFHAAMIGPYLERFHRENSHLVRRRSPSATGDDQPAKGKV